MVRLSKGMPACRVRGSNEGRESAIRRALFFQLMPERTPFAPPPHFMKVLGGGGGTRASLVGLVGEGGRLSSERFLLPSSSPFRAAHNKKRKAKWPSFLNFWLGYVDLNHD